METLLLDIYSFVLHKCIPNDYINANTCLSMNLNSKACCVGAEIIPIVQLRIITVFLFAILVRDSIVVNEISSNY